MPGGLHWRLRRRARHLVERVGAAELPAQEPVRIDDLVSPLRYDVLTRQSYLALLAELLEEGWPTVLERSREHEYFTWFTSVVVPRFAPELIGHGAGIADAFEVRVRKTVELLHSVQDRGLDPAHPITLRTGLRIRSTSTGKRLGRRVYVRDGCHRLAMMRASGLDELEPGTYRLQTQRWFEPLDNTLPMLRALSPTAQRYWEFMALSYEGLVAEDRSGPAPDGAAADPERFAEMLEVASVDAPFVLGAGLHGRELPGIG